MPGRIKCQYLFFFLFFFLGNGYLDIDRKLQSLLQKWDKRETEKRTSPLPHPTPPLGDICVIVKQEGSLNAKKAVFWASQNGDTVGKVWPAAQLLNSFLFKPTLAEGKCSFLSFFHHFCFLKGKKKPSRKIQRHTDVTERGDLGHNQKLVSGELPHPHLHLTIKAWL